MCIAAFLSQTFSALFSANRMDPVVCRTPLPRGVQSSAHCEAHASPWLPQWVPTSVQSNTYSQNFSQASTQRPEESCDIPCRVQSINAQLESELRSQWSLRLQIQCSFPHLTQDAITGLFWKEKEVVHHGSDAVELNSPSQVIHSQLSEEVGLLDSWAQLPAALVSAHLKRIHL